MTDMDETKIRKQLVFTGRVQGVGFRWRAGHAARAVGATGWVQNRYDGSVDRSPYIQIDGLEVRRIPLLDGERGFVALDDGR